MIVFVVYETKSNRSIQRFFFGKTVGNLVFSFQQRSLRFNEIQSICMPNNNR